MVTRTEDNFPHQQECIESTFATITCHPFVNSDASCACRDLTTLEKARDCITIACSRKDELNALRITLGACTDKPIRDKSTSYRRINVAFYSLAILAMVAQWVVRFTVGRLQWLDDGNMVMVLALDTVLFAVCYIMSFTGLGLDMWNVPFKDITTTLLVWLSISSSTNFADLGSQYFWISEIAYFTALGFIKISFLLFFLQIFPDKKFRRFVWFVIYFQLASMVAFGFAATFVCTPISFAWKQWDGEHTGACINNNVLAFTHAAHSIVVDFVTLSLPITQIWKLHLGLKKKIGVLLMFSVGAL